MLSRLKLAYRRKINVATACQPRFSKGQRSDKMLWTICVILLVLWALGMATSYTAGGLIHILLVVAVVVLLFRLIQGRRVV
jgi:hypothetical protein